MNPKKYTFKNFLNDRSTYFFYFFETPHWIGAIVYLILGLAQAFIVGLILSSGLIFIMYLIRKNQIIKH